MFSHVMVGTNNIEESRIFYDKLFEVLGGGPGKLYPNLTGQKRYFYNLEGTSFCITEPIDGKPATVSNGATVGFNIENIEVSKPFEINFDKNKVVDAGFIKAFSELISKITISSDRKVTNEIKLNQIKGMI